MLSPYWFVQSIEESKFSHARQAMAALALNLYYGESAMSFDVSRIVELSNFDRVACIAAITWVSSHSSCSGDKSFPAEEIEFLGERTYKRLLRITKRRPAKQTLS